MKFTQGNLLDVLVNALVNAVNCVGVMGRGIAAQFKEAFPANVRAYAAACKRGVVTPGRMFVFATGQASRPRFIINFPTKRHWRDKSTLADIDAGLAALVREVETRGIRSIAIPALGSGLGGLKWTDVRPKIEAAFARSPSVRIVVFEPHDEARRGRTPTEEDP